MLGNLARVTLILLAGSGVTRVSTAQESFDFNPNYQPTAGQGWDPIERRLLPLPPAQEPEKKDPPPQQPTRKLTIGTVHVSALHTARQAEALLAWDLSLDIASKGKVESGGYLSGFSSAQATHVVFFLERKWDPELSDPLGQDDDYYVSEVTRGSRAYIVLRFVHKQEKLAGGFRFKGSATMSGVTGQAELVAAWSSHFSEFDVSVDGYVLGGAQLTEVLGNAVRVPQKVEEVQAYVQTLTSALIGYVTIPPEKLGEAYKTETVLRFVVRRRAEKRAISLWRDLDSHAIQVAREVEHLSGFPANDIRDREIDLRSKVLSDLSARREEFQNYQEILIDDPKNADVRLRLIDFRKQLLAKIEKDHELGIGKGVPERPVIDRNGEHVQVGPGHCLRYPPKYLATLEASRVLKDCAAPLAKALGPMAQAEQLGYPENVGGDHGIPRAHVWSRELSVRVDTREKIRAVWILGTADGIENRLTEIRPLLECDTTGPQLAPNPHFVLLNMPNMDEAVGRQTFTARIPIAVDQTKGTLKLLDVRGRTFEFPLLLLP